MASGYHRVNGIAVIQLFYRLYQNGEKLPCDPTVSFSCVDEITPIMKKPIIHWTIRSGQESTFDATLHFGDYWYTNDLKIVLLCCNTSTE